MNIRIKMNQEAINHLLALLGSNKTVIDTTLLNNLVYYTPRIRSQEQLIALVNAIFDSHSLRYIDLKELYCMAQAIAIWKLEISEPSIMISSFYDIWDACFAKCESWTLSKLSILGGILSTKETFTRLQLTTFIDDTGRVKACYDKWRKLYFIPIMNQFLGIHHAKSIPLVLIYATISEEEDSSKNLVDNWNIITWSLSEIFSLYMLSPDEQDKFTHSRINQVAKTLQISVTRSTENVVSSFLSVLCRDCYDLSIIESRSMPNKSYSTKHYSDILFTISLTLRGILESPRLVPISWYVQSAMILFCINFITEDIGSNGLNSYETVYESTTVAIATTNNYRIYSEVLNTMRGNIWYDSNLTFKLNTAKLLFMLKFMGTTLSEVNILTPKLISDIIMPLEMRFIESSNEEIRESVHVFVISVFMNAKCIEVAEWQSKNYLNYMCVALNQFMQDKMTDKQIILIYGKMSSRVPHLKRINKHLLRDTLHHTYLRILNCQTYDLSKQKTLLKCIIIQIPYLDQEYIISWLDTCQELLNNINFTTVQQNEILSTLWDVVSSFKSDVALQWWYNQIVPLKARI